MQSGYAVGGWGYVIWNTPFSEDGAGGGCSCRNTWFHPTSDDPTTDNTVVSQNPDSAAVRRTQLVKTRHCRRLLPCRVCAFFGEAVILITRPFQATA
jgi:hypothetical protein